MNMYAWFEWRIIYYAKINDLINKPGKRRADRNAGRFNSPVFYFFQTEKFY